MTLCEKFHTTPFELRRERFSEVLLLIERLSNHNRNEMKKYRRVKQPDGSYTYVKKVYANDNDSI